MIRLKKDVDINILLNYGFEEGNSFYYENYKQKPCKKYEYSISYEAFIKVKDIDRYLDIQLDKDEWDEHSENDYAIFEKLIKLTQDNIIEIVDSKL